jgi:hypothetical protein
MPRGRRAGGKLETIIAIAGMKMRARTTLPLTDHPRLDPGRLSVAQPSLSLLQATEALTFASPPLLCLSVAIASRFTGLPIPAPPAQPQQRPDAALVELELIKESIRRLLGRLKK